ncbi:hypothetical protein [Gordonia amicalis]|uniref:4Fe-4S Wbl-type domain-containing protein n=1 Tax=Gordonia amicalis TaxID=89053 RepID=A0ABU4DJR2_9ACTN|nr:hypothetical protein [Gordonia amicalis]MDV6309984.1 hypothetical protein [Gordonia amicalis]
MWLVDIEPFSIIVDLWGPHMTYSPHFRENQCLNTADPGVRASCYNQPDLWDLELILRTWDPLTAARRAEASCYACPLFNKCRSQALARASAGSPPLDVIEGGIAWSPYGQQLDLSTSASLVASANARRGRSERALLPNRLPAPDAKAAS